MKGLLVAVVVAAIAAVMFAWRDEQPELQVIQRQEEPDGPPRDDADVPAPARTEVEFRAPEPQVVEEAPLPEPVKPVEEPAAPKTPEWKPTVAEFVEAGLTQQEAECLVVGLKHMMKDFALAEAIDKQKGGLGTPIVSTRIVLGLGPTLAGLIKEKRIEVKSGAWLRPEFGRDTSSFGAGFENDGSFRELTFCGRDSWGHVTLCILPALISEELVRALEGAHQLQK